MAKRLLFVDDEPMVLDGLRRALWSMRNEWEMRFVTSGAAALEALGRESFDAIITDMQMPSMDGAQLLEMVKESHGDLVRIVLSGQSKKETILRSISPAHQFLSKPCNVQELKTRLSQAFTRRDLLRDGPLASIVAQMRSIPSVPTLYNDLTAALRSENATLGQIEEIISKDVGMAAKILQLANSAFIAAHGRVSSLHESVSLIGAETIRSLALTIHVFSQFDRNAATATYLPVLRDHSVAVASLAHRIAVAKTGTKSVAEESFTAGLLHDVGKIVLLAEMPNEYQMVLETLEVHPQPFRNLEIDSAGSPHEQNGAYLMSVWGLPGPIVQAVEFHHTPPVSGQNQFTALTAVHCADAIASANDPSAMNRDGELNQGYVEALGLAEELPDWRRFHEEYLRAKAQQDLEEAANRAAA